MQPFLRSAAFIGATLMGFLTATTDPPSTKLKLPGTSLGADMHDIDASVRELLERDSQRVGKVAENLVGVQGDIGKVEQEALGKVFDMSTMKPFLAQNELAIQKHEELETEQSNLRSQTALLSRQLDAAIRTAAMQSHDHRTRIAQMNLQNVEDKSAIQKLQKELNLLVEMQKVVQHLSPVNANLTAHNTEGVATAKVATEGLLFERSKLESYKDTTSKLKKELLKQRRYADRCHQRLQHLGTQLHDIASQRAAVKYEQGQSSAQGVMMEELMKEKIRKVDTRLQKSRANLQTIAFGKQSTKVQIAELQVEGQRRLERMKSELGKLRQQAASIEVAMMAKVTNRKQIEKALHAVSLQVEDMQGRMLAGKLEKLRSNSTQMTKDLKELRQGMQHSQIVTAKAEERRSQLRVSTKEKKEHAKKKRVEAQVVARDFLAQIVAAKQSAEDVSQRAQAAMLQAQASMLTKCGDIWDKEHPQVLKELRICKRVKLDLQSVKASVIALITSVKSVG